MSKEKISALIDKAIGKKGPLRIPAYWMREVLNKINNRIPTSNGQLTNDSGYITIKDTFSNVDTTNLKKYANNELMPNTLKIHEGEDGNYNVAINASGTGQIYRYGLILRNSTSQRYIKFLNSIYWSKPFPGYIQPFENIFITITKDSTGTLYGDFELSKHKKIVLTYNITTLEPITLFHSDYKNFPPRTMIVDDKIITPTNVLEFESTGIHTVEIESDLLAGLFNSASNEKYLQSAICNYITCVENNAFNRCKALTSIVLSDDVEIIGYNAFYNCISLEEFTLPKNIGRISKDAFFNSKIKKLHIKSLKNWCECYKEDYGFMMNKSLTIYVNGEPLDKLEVPYGTKRIEQYSFFNYKLSNVVIADGVEYIGKEAFHECGISSITIPATLKEVGQSAFFGNQNLSKVYIEDLRAWCECHFNTYQTSNPIIYGAGLYLNGVELSGSIVIPDGTRHIGVFAFSNYGRATSIIVPSSVMLLYAGAFDRCISVQYYDFSTHNKVPTLERSNVFYGIPSECKIIVPDNLYDEWIVTTNWSIYADYIIKKSDWDAQQLTE